MPNSRTAPYCPEAQSIAQFALSAGLKCSTFIIQFLITGNGGAVAFFYILAW